MSLTSARILFGTLDLPTAKRAGADVEEGTLGGRPATIMRPRTSPPWPAVLFANGATPDGRAHPTVRRLGLALAASGYLVYVPDLPGIAAGELVPGTLAAAIACTNEAADSPEARSGRIGLIGVSVGGTLALLTAADPGLSARVSVVACIAPYTDLRKVMMLATTGMYPGPHGFEPYSVPEELTAGLGRSFVALHSWTSATEDLLVNTDPHRFGALYQALPEEVREIAASLSPVRSAANVLAPIEIATARRDRYFPLAESEALADAARNVRITVTSALAHATPAMRVSNLAGVARLHGFFARSLAAAL